MKNKLIYFMAVLFTAFTCFSCSDSDNDENSDLSGSWKYKTAHFTLEYPEENIPLPDGMKLGDLIPNLGEIGNLTAIPVSLINMGLPSFADDKMKEYFKGIEFISDSELKVLYKMGGEEGSIKAVYKVQKDFIEVTLDKEDLKVISGKDLTIPKFSLNYDLSNGKLTLFLNKAAIQGMITPLMPMLIQSLLPNTTPQEQAGFIAYVGTILAKATKLEIGAVLER